MTPEEIDLVDRRLRSLQEELRSEQATGAENAAIVELDQARVGRLSRMDDLQQQAMAQELNRRRDIQLKRVEGALIRLEKGTYGHCVTCGSDIPEERLAFDPTVFFCQACATRAERR